MPWPETPDVRPLDEWRDHVKRRGRHLRMVRRGIIASIATASVGCAVVIPVVLAGAGTNGLERLNTVTPAGTPSAQPGSGNHAHRAGRTDSAGAHAPSATAAHAASIRSSPLVGNSTGAGAGATGPGAPATTPPSYVLAPFAMSRSLSCTRSHDGTATCPGGSVQLDPPDGLVTTHAFVQTGSDQNSVDWYASDTATGIVTAHVWLAHAAETARVTVDYRIVRAAQTSTSPGNTATNSLDVATQLAGCPDCAGTDTTTLPSGSGQGATAALTVDITNTDGGLVPAGWVTVSVSTVSFATIGTCAAPCGQPGNGNASASVSTAVERIGIAAVS